MKGQFTTLALRTYVENHPGGTDYAIHAMHIMGGPKGKDTEYVILETSNTMCHPTHYEAHFYNTREEMLTAFRKGLEVVLNPPPEIKAESEEDFLRSLINKPKNPFTEHPGFVRTFVVFESGQAPWFLAETDDVITGDLAVTPGNEPVEDE
jgi:hypothetical protein